MLYPGQSLYTQNQEVVHREDIKVKDGTFKDADAIACVAVKSLSQGVCEMKRTFVRKQYRGMGLGNLLARAAVREAKNAGLFHTIKLDSLERLPFAVSMYAGLGFKACEPYVPNPEPDAVFMEMPLPVRPQPGNNLTEDAAQV